MTAMISLKEVNSEIKQILNTRTDDKKDSEINRMKTRLKFLNWMKAYLEGEPSIDFVRAELKKMETRLSGISDGFFAFSKDCKVANDMKEQKKIYEKEYGVKEIKLQIKTLKYLLKQ